MYQPTYFHLLPLLKHDKKVVSGLIWKESGLRKPENTCAPPTAMI